MIYLKSSSFCFQLIYGSIIAQSIEQSKVIFQDDVQVPCVTQIDCEAWKLNYSWLHQELLCDKGIQLELIEHVTACTLHMSFIRF